MKTCAVLILFSLCSFAKAQCADTGNPVLIKTERGTQMSLKELGRSLIILKDGSIKKDCYITEIKEESIVYLKGKVLHDMLIDKIKRIESIESNLVMVFTNGNIPLIRYTPIYND